MATTVQILTTNYSGQTATITFSPCSGGTINLGSQVVPYNYVSDNYLGDYSLYFADFSQTCTFSIPCSTATPTPTVIVATATPTPTPTETPIPATETPTPQPTSTPTETPVPAPATPTPAPTDTATPTPLPVTDTPTPQPTNEATHTPTPTTTPTNTPTTTPIPNISGLTFSKSYTYDCTDGLVFTYSLVANTTVDYNTFIYFVDEIDLVSGGTITITGSTGISAGNISGTTIYNNNTTPSTPTGYTHISKTWLNPTNIPVLPSKYAIHWTLNEQTLNEQTLPLSVYIDFSDNSAIHTPYIINEASGGAIMVSSHSDIGPKYNQTTSVTDFLDLSADGSSGPFYCNLYQMGNVSQTDNDVDYYKMSLTMIPITDVSLCIALG